MSTAASQTEVAYTPSACDTPTTYTCCCAAAPAGNQVQQQQPLAGAAVLRVSQQAAAERHTHSEQPAGAVRCGGGGVREGNIFWQVEGICV